MSSKEFLVTYADNTEEKVRPLLVDTLAFETALRKNRSWGELKDNALRATPFRAWNALRRENKTGESWDDWSARVVDVVSVQDDDEEDDDLAGSVGKDTPPDQHTSY